MGGNTYSFKGSLEEQAEAMEASETTPVVVVDMVEAIPQETKKDGGI